MRALAVLLLLLPAYAHAGEVNTRLLAYYGQPQNYRKVKADVLSWYGTTKDGCVAFASSALRHIGVAVSRDGDYDGERVSLQTRPFSLYLERELGWRRVTAALALRPGDVVFTREPDYPWHTYVFVRWKRRAQRIAWVIDNQGFTHVRAVLGPGSGHWTPFAYALRSPD
ncbi:MAG TPA: hypothetical protein VGQ83_27975 [Polyangia bacterium]|jgi:hypothetical protein